jgi:hypothetical protein
MQQNIYTIAAKKVRKSRKTLSSPKDLREKTTEEKREDRKT